MEKNPRPLSLFLSELDHQVGRIVRIFSILESKQALLSGGAVSSEQVESTGYWLHNLYSAFEDLFKIVAGFWENSIQPDRGFHANLLKRMLLRIEGVRPPVISEGSFLILSELKGFRHVFRHAYSYELDDERVRFLLRRVLERKEGLLNDLDQFRTAVAGLDFDSRS
jgi:hypothetical protein